MRFSKTSVIAASISLILFSVVPVLAQEASPTAVPTGSRRERIEERRQEIQDRRDQRKQDIVNRMKTRLAAVVDRMNNVVKRLREHVAKIRARAQELNTNRGADVSAVETSLKSAEEKISSAETKIANLKASIESLDETTTLPRTVAQTFRQGAQEIHKLFQDTRKDLVAAVKALRDAAKASRPTVTGQAEPTAAPTITE